MFDLENICIASYFVKEGCHILGGCVYGWVGWRVWMQLNTIAVLKLSARPAEKSGRKSHAAWHVISVISDTDPYWIALEES